MAEILMVTKEKTCYKGETSPTISCLKQEIDEDIARFKQNAAKLPQNGQNEMTALISRKNKGNCLEESKDLKNCELECVFKFPYRIHS
jgi:hypothetical protein